MDHRKAQKALSPLLVPAGKGYGAVMRLRAWAYTEGLKKSSRPEAFCISVGNISWGGSGKTPLTGWLLAWAEKNGLKAAVLTRGYGGKSETRPLLVKQDTPPSASGDEPLMLARMHPQAFILADPVRKRSLAWADEHLKPDIYILDDGMQHLALQRDLNLVVLRVSDLKEEWNKVIPAGSWRESKEALARADAFMLRASTEEFERVKELVQQRLGEYGVPVFAFDVVPGGITKLLPPQYDAALRSSGNGTYENNNYKNGCESVADNATAPCATPENFHEPACRFSGPEADSSPLPQAFSDPSAKYALCTAVGTPDSVRTSAALAIGREAEREFIYPDHYAYSAEDLDKVAATGLPVIITAKDAVKIAPLLASRTCTLGLANQDKLPQRHEHRESSSHPVYEDLPAQNYQSLHTNREADRPPATRADLAARNVLPETGDQAVRTARKEADIFEKPSLDVYVLNARVELGPALFSDLNFAEWLKKRAGNNPLLSN